MLRPVAIRLLPAPRLPWKLVLPPLRPIPWKFVLLASYVGVNLILVPMKIVLGPDKAVDWDIFRRLPDAIASGSVYDLGTAVPFAWSPVAAWIMAGVALVGYWPWVVAHIAAALLLYRTPLLLALVLVSYSFWFDVAQGNTVSLAFIAGILALQGSRPAGLAYLGLLLLVPRPLMAPLAIWLLWHDRSLWRPFAMLFVLHAALVLVSGDALTWLGLMISYDLAPGITIGPSAWLGRLWLLVGIPIAAFAALRGNFGWAGLAMSPYITPQYPLMLLWELAPRHWSTDERQPHAGALGIAAPHVGIRTSQPPRSARGTAGREVPA